MAITGRSLNDRVFDTINYTLLTLVLIVVAYPLLFVVASSFSDPLAVMGGKVWLWPVRPNLKAYRMVFRDPDIMTGYRNTLAYTVTGTLLNLAMTTAAAYPLSRRNLRGKGLITALMAFTMFFSGGLIPTYLVVLKLGLIDRFGAMILPNAVAVMNIIIMRTFFQTSIPYELEEAAFVDGCTNLGSLWRIVLPLSKPIIAVMVLFYGVGHWNAFFNGLIYLNSQGKFPLQLIMRGILIQNQMSQEMVDEIEDIASRQMMAEGIKYALIIVASLPVLALYPLLQKYFVQGVMIGAIKG